MNKKQIHILVSWLLAVAVAATGLPARSQDNGALRSAFGNLRQSIGEEAVAGQAGDSSAEVDAALDSAFNPDPEPLRKSDVTLDQVASDNQIERISAIANTPINGPFTIDFRTEGAMISMLLWKGAETELKTLTVNILKQLYSFSDPQRLRIIVSSDPVPYMDVGPCDMNDEARERAIRFAYVPMSAESAKQQYPELPGLQLKMSAGMFATFKSVDEYAARLARALASQNPKIYGVETDPRFQRNQAYVSLVEQAVLEASSESERKEQEKLKDGVKADLSAMEKLAAGGFNPWALYNHEVRKMSWMSDVFLKSPKHSLGRWMVRKGKAGLFDWTRPIRLQIQSTYMAHLQNVGRVRNLDDTEFSLGLKWIRLRMKLFTEPYFAGVVKQATVAGGAIGAGLLFTLHPELLHNALMAVYNTLPHANAEQVAAQGSNSSSIGNFVKSLSDITQEVLDNSYFGISPREIGARAISAIQKLREHYVGALEIVGAIAAEEFLRRYASSISMVIRAAGEEIGRGKAETVSVDEKDLAAAPADEATGVDPNDPSIDDTAEMVAAVKRKPEIGIKQRIIGQKIGRFLRGTGNAAVAVYGAGGKLVSATGRAAAKTGQIAVLGTVGTGRLLALLARGTCVGVAGGCRMVARGTVAMGPALKSAMRRYVETSRLKRLQKMSLEEEDETSSTLQVAKELSRSSLEDASFMSISFSALGTAAVGGLLIGGLIIMLPIKLGVGTYRLSAEAVDEIKSGIRRRAIERQAARNQEQDRQEKLRRAHNNLEDVITSKDTELAEVQVLLDNNFGTRYIDEAMANLGIDKEKRGAQKEYYQTFLRLVQRWMELAEKKRPPLESFNRIYNLMGRMYIDRASDIEKLGLKNNLLETSAQFVDLVYRLRPATFAADFEKLMVSCVLRKDTKTYVSLYRRPPKDGGDRAGVVLAAGEYSEFREQILRETIRGHESEVIDWMASKESDTQKVSQVFKILTQAQTQGKVSLSRFISRLSFKYSKSLLPIQRAKLSVVAKEMRPFVSSDVIASFQNSIPEQVDIWLHDAKNIQDLSAKMESDCTAYKISPDLFATELMDKLRNRTDLIGSLDDVRVLFSKNYFWSDSRKSQIESPLEAPLLELLRQRRLQYSDNPAWKYDPVEAEKSHSAVRARLLALKLYPTQFDELESFWQLFTSRGLSTVTDGMLDELIKAASPEKISVLEYFAVHKGRVFDQSLRDEFALRQIKSSPEYLTLMQAKDNVGGDRMGLINRFIDTSRNLLRDLGLKFSELMETVSQDIHSTKEEARVLHDAKIQKFADDIRRRNGDGSDSRIKTFQGILPYVKNWKEKDQYEFLLYLRGQESASEFIEKQFPRFGPERIRRMYQSLPLEARMGVVEMYLQETFLARKNVDDGYGKKLIEHLVSTGTSEDVREYSSLLLESLLHGIVEAKNPPFQKKVLSALVAMDPNQKRSIGETIKMILEQFPGVGPKVGQFLVATRRLPKDINSVLALTQDGTKPPARYDIYEDISMIAGNRPDLGITLLDLLGGGSLKYSVSAIENKSRQEMALQVFREDAQNNLDLQISVLDSAITYLIKKIKNGRSCESLSMARSTRFKRSETIGANQRRRCSHA